MKENKKLTYKQQQKREKAKTIVKWVLCGLGWSLLATAFISLLVVGIRGCNNNKQPAQALTGNITTPVKPVQPNNVLYYEDETTSQYVGNEPYSSLSDNVVTFFRGNNQANTPVGSQYSWSLANWSDKIPMPFTTSRTSGTDNPKTISFFRDTTTQIGATIKRPEQYSAQDRLGALKVKLVRVSLYEANSSQLWYTIQELIDMALNNDNRLTYTTQQLDNVYSIAMVKQSSVGKLVFYDVNDSHVDVITTSFIPISNYVNVQTGQSTWTHSWSCYLSLSIETKPYREICLRYSRAGYYNGGGVSLDRPYLPQDSIFVASYINGYDNIIIGDTERSDYYCAIDYIPQYFKRGTILYNDFVNEDNETSGGTGDIGTTGGYENFFTLIAQAFRSIADLMAIEVLPHITLGTLVFIPLVFTIVIFIIWLIKR